MRINALRCGGLGEGLPPIDLTHGDLSGRQHARARGKKGGNDQASSSFAISKRMLSTTRPFWVIGT
jgi:hypothetical protein